MKTKLFVWAALTIFLGVGMGTAGAATNDVSALLQKGLFEEEANQNLDGAIEAYQAVIAQAEKTRQFAATAIFRLGECYRKEGKTNEAASQYQRILSEFADQTTLATLSRQNLAGMGVAAAGVPTPDNSDAMLWNKVKDLSPADLEEVLPTLAPDPVLTTLLQNREEAEAKLTQLLATEGEHNPEFLTEKSLLDVLNKQISDKTAGIMLALKLRAEISGTAGSAAATAPGSETTSDEDEEIRRIQEMVQNSPDLINVAAAGAAPPLVLAAREDHLRVAQYLLDHGADVDVQDVGMTPLMAAAMRGHKAMAELLLSRGANVNAKDKAWATALHQAAIYGFQGVVEVLLAHHADVNLPDNSGITPLEQAAGRGQLKITQILLAAGANPNAKENNGFTPLMGVANGDSPETAKLLLAAGADPNAESDAGRTPLSLAAQKGSAEIVRILLEAKADPNGGKLDQPLLAAIHANDTNSVELLLRAGANPNAVGNADWPDYVSNFINVRQHVTPLWFAVHLNQLPMVQLLLKYRADPNDPQTEGLAVIFDSLAKPEILEALLDAGANTEAKGNNGATPLIVAAQNAQYLGAAKLLLDHKADVNAQDNEYNSALSLAVANNLPDMVKLILTHKPKVDILDKDGWTPLEKAVEFEKVASAGLLLDAGANVLADYPRSGGMGLLKWAVQRANKPLVEVLLMHKADPNAQDDSGGTPLSAAKQLESDPNKARVMGEIVELLLKAGANDNLQRLSTISVSRDSANFTKTVFLKGTNSFNHYTLFELLTAFYAPPAQEQMFSGRQLPGSELAFPDFGRIRISRLQKDGRTNVIAVDFAKAMNAGDCSADVPLEWGDVVEIPESDHKMGETWTGLTDQEGQALWKCLGGQVAIVVKGQTNLVSLTLRCFRPAQFGGFNGTSFNINYPTGFSFRHGVAYTSSPPAPAGPWSFWLCDVVQGANVILTSSDLSRVKVTRSDAATGKNVEMVFELQANNPANGLWLRDGDVIEIPEKP